MSMGEPEPAPPEWEDGGAGREVDDGVEAAIAVLEGEPLVILRSDSADAQADKVNALRAALHGRPIRMLRLDGKHPRGLAPLATPEPEADRAVLVVEHADRLDPATLDALRDVENLQLVLFHRLDARRPMWSGMLEPASVRFPPGHLVAFELDPKRRRWRTLAVWAVLAVAAGGVLLAGVLYYDLRGRSRDVASNVAAVQDAAPSPSHLATPPSAPAAPPAPAPAPAPASATAPAPAVNPAPAPEAAGATSQPPSSPPTSTPPPPATGPQTDASTAPAGTPGGSLEQLPSKAAAPATAPATADVAPSPEPPAGEAPPAAATAGSQPPPPAAQRAQLKRDFERFLAADRHMPKHLSRAQRRALFDKFLEWRASQASSATR